MNTSIKAAPDSKWLYLVLVLTFPVILTLPHTVYRTCFTRCIPEINEIVGSLIGFLFLLTLVSFIGILVWGLKISQRGQRLHIALLWVAALIIGLILWFFGALGNMFLATTDFSKAYIPELKKWYYVEQIGMIPEGYSWLLYEAHGPFKTLVGKSQWRWHSTQLNGANINLLAEPTNPGAPTFLYNVETRTLILGSSLRK